MKTHIKKDRSFKILAAMILITGAFFVLVGAANAADYVYKQGFMPKETVKLDLATTAMFVTDPQNDFLSEKSPAWGLVGPTVIKNKVVEKEKTLKALAKKIGVPVFYSTHMYTPQDFANWKSLNGIDKIMFDIKMFEQGTWGHDYHPELKPDSNTIVMNPHKGLSNFWTGDAALQLRQYGIETIILYGMSANLCIESHARDAIENGFDVIIVADATAAAGDAAYEAALTNFEFLAHEVVTTDQIVKRLKAAKR
jgi:nicotinamidase-related amidase